MSNFNNTDHEQRNHLSRTERQHYPESLGFETTKEPLWFIKTRHVINYFLAVVEVLLLFRLTFKLLGANPHNAFVAFLYSVTRVLIAPFYGIFNSFVTNGLSAKSVFEPATIIGMIVYVVIAWGLISLLRIKATRDGY